MTDLLQLSRGCKDFVGTRGRDGRRPVNSAFLKQSDTKRLRLCRDRGFGSTPRSRHCDYGRSSERIDGWMLRVLTAKGRRSRFWAHKSEDCKLGRIGTGWMN